MEIRRRKPKFRKQRYQLIVLLYIAFAFSQAEFQILTIPSNANMLSYHNGFSASIDSVYNKKMHNLDLIQFPADIVFQKIKYNQFSIAILDYGELIDQIDNQIIKKFDSYEISFQYLYDMRIKNKFLVSGSSGIIYSQIDNLNSIGIASNIKLLTAFKKNNLNVSIGIKNLGLIINSYTKNSNRLPLQYQFGASYNVSKTTINLGYDVIYHTNTNIYEKIYCLSFPVGKIISLKFSSHNWRNNLLIDNYKNDWFYGLSYGISINAKNAIFDIGVGNLGSAGYIYGLSIGFK